MIDDDDDDDANREEHTATDNVSDGFLTSASVKDFRPVATLGVGGFGRVELVRIIPPTRRQLTLHSALEITG